MRLVNVLFLLQGNQELYTKIKKEEIDVDVVDHTSIFHVGSLSLQISIKRYYVYAVKRAKNKGSIILTIRTTGHPFGQVKKLP